MYLALCHPSDIRDLNVEQLQYIPKVVLLRVYGDYIEYIWDKLPEREGRFRGSNLSSLPWLIVVLVAATIGSNL